MKPSINQRSTLEKTLKEISWVNVQFDTETIYDALKNITLKQYKYIIFLKANKKSLKLRDMLISIGVKQKI